MRCRAVGTLARQYYSPAPGMFASVFCRGSQVKASSCNECTWAELLALLCSAQVWTVRPFLAGNEAPGKPLLLSPSPLPALGPGVAASQDCGCQEAWCEVRRGECSAERGRGPRY